MSDKPISRKKPGDSFSVYANTALHALLIAHPSLPDHDIAERSIGIAQMMVNLEQDPPKPEGV